MTQTDWPSKVTARVADALRARREELGLTAQDVADACSVLGYPIPRSVIANLENGRRASVGLAEILILAEVLGVPPITMLFPLGTAPTIEVLPGREVSMWDAVAWVTGESREEAMKAPAQTVLNMFREHGILVSVALLSRRMGEEKRREAALASDPEHRARFLGMVAEFDRIHARDIQALRDWRARMREQEVVPPALPDDFAYLESSESAQ
ncbi:helix-turn-helix domain-containing protein [Kitasatospora purpeofusca]|uniref:Helix-turn-helix domain-containing protein n=1 Tax=Kitasatospora purpeofusca TaxID=67352 RepID=A0ABZ1U268_9ACTN|nr:helix-turn-helix domain-containing protein [Kitasatospora purpeofusca]